MTNHHSSPSFITINHHWFNPWFCLRLAGHHQSTGLLPELLRSQGTWKDHPRDDRMTGLGIHQRFQQLPVVISNGSVSHSDFPATKHDSRFHQEKWCFFLFGWQCEIWVIFQEKWSPATHGFKWPNSSGWWMATRRCHQTWRAGKWIINRWFSDWNLHL